MKMPEKHDLLAAILAAKEQGIRQSFGLHNGVPSQQMLNGGAFTKTLLIDATMYHYRLVHS